MFNDLRNTEWMIRVMTKNEQEFQSVLQRDQKFNQKFQKIMNGITSFFFYSFQLTALYQNFWIMEIEFIPNMFQSNQTSNPLMALIDFLCTSSLVLLYFTTLRSFYNAARINPAKIQYKIVELEFVHNNSDDNLNESHNSEEFGGNFNSCHICLMEKDLGTHHCRVCQVCIDGMDHHCYFLGNCVGTRNYSYFFSYFFLVMILAKISMFSLRFELIKLINFQFNELKVNAWRLLFVYVTGIFVLFLSMYLLQSLIYKFELYYLLRLLSLLMEVLRQI